jgi:hypothetical protein
MAVNLNKLHKVNQAREILEIVAAAPSTSWERIREAVELLEETYKRQPPYLVQCCDSCHLEVGERKPPPWLEKREGEGLGISIDSLVDDEGK